MNYFAEVIGDPVDHSKSPIIHRFWLERCGLAGDYRARHVASDGLGAYLQRRADDASWRGCNVTLPHKVAVMKLLDRCDDVATAIGAVNTVVRGGDRILLGSNTDAAGFAGPLRDLPLSGSDVVVVGAGGAARAILFALATLQVGSVTIYNRTPETGAALLSRFGLNGEARSLDRPLPPAALLVNTSTMGMAGYPRVPLDLALLPRDAVIYDIVYAPLETVLLAEARAHGLRVIDGLEMLIGQAALAFERFFGVAPPRHHDHALRALLTR